MEALPAGVSVIFGINTLSIKYNVRTRTDRAVIFQGNVIFGSSVNHIDDGMNCNYTFGKNQEYIIYFRREDLVVI